MKKYDIWVEGFKVQERSGKAQCLAKDVEGNSLSDAVKTWYSNIPDAEAKYGKLRIEENDISLWGCRVFDNEIEARKSFG